MRERHENAARVTNAERQPTVFKKLQSYVGMRSGGILATVKPDSDWLSLVQNNTSIIACQELLVIVANPQRERNEKKPLICQLLGASSFDSKKWKEARENRKKEEKGPL